MNRVPVSTYDSFDVLLRDDCDRSEVGCTDFPLSAAFDVAFTDVRLGRFVLRFDSVVFFLAVRFDVVPVDLDFVVFLAADVVRREVDLVVFCSELAELDDVDVFLRVVRRVVCFFSPVEPDDRRPDDEDEDRAPTICAAALTDEFAEDSPEAARRGREPETERRGVETELEPESPGQGSGSPPSRLFTFALIAMLPPNDGSNAWCAPNPCPSRRKPRKA